MKILLVDDESYKLKKLMKIIMSIDGINKEDIYSVLELNKAKEQLMQFEYDFMILDLNMPEVLGEDPQKNAGADFIDEIIQVDRYIKPNEIIVLTAFDELEGEFKELQNKLAFPILKYDESSVKWEEIIKSKIRYGLLREKNKIRPNCNYNYDVAIITAIKNETEAVKRISDNWTKDLKVNDPIIYYKTEIERENKKLKIVTAQQTEMGMSAAATLTTKLINDYRPKYIIMVGIAAGIGSDKRLGDIIVSSEVWNYSSGKYITPKEGSESLLDFIPDAMSIPLNPKIKSIINQDFDDVLYKIKKKWPNSPSYDLNVICGPMACGSAVVANSKIVDDLVKSHSRKTVGLDMESYGMFYAAVNTSLCNTIPICIKSISDFADSHKEDGYQKYAAYTSVEFMKFLIQEELEF